jgi:hypothetical protein
MSFKIIKEGKSFVIMTAKRQNRGKFWFSRRRVSLVRSTILGTPAESGDIPIQAFDNIVEAYRVMDSLENRVLSMETA